LVPRRMPTATRMASFDRRRPTAVIGGAWSQSPECADCAARNLARDTASVTYYNFIDNNHFDRRHRDR